LRDVDDALVDGALMNPRAERQRAGAGRLDVVVRMRPGVLKLLHDAEAGARRLDAADRLVASLLIVAPWTGLAADGQRLDAFDDRVVRIDVAVEPANFAIGDEVDTRLLNVADGGVRGVVEHLVHVARAEVALLERLDRGEPPARFSVGADDRGRDQGQGHRERPPIIRETPASRQASSGRPAKMISPRSIT